MTAGLDPAVCFQFSSALSSFCEGTMMKRTVGHLASASVLLLGVLSLPVRADDKPADLPAAPKGFDQKRDGIERGKVEAVEYDSKSIGSKRRAVVYTPPGYSKDSKYPVLYLLH